MIKVPAGKIPLKYQSTKYDCVPTTFLNAINYLFEIDEIKPEVSQRILQYSLDTINRNGEQGKRGTTGLSCRFILQWLGQFYEKDLECEYVSGNEVHLGQNNKLVRWVNEGGVALCSVVNTVSMNHYMLCTEADSDFLYFFDPWFRQQQYRGTDSMELITDEWNYNLKVSRQRLDEDISEKYSFGPVKDREVCLMKRVSK